MIKQAYAAGHQEAFEKLALHPAAIPFGIAASVGLAAGFATGGKHGVYDKIKSEMKGSPWYKNMGTTVIPAAVAGGLAAKSVKKRKFAAGISAALITGKLGHEANKAFFLNERRKERGLPPLKGWFVHDEPVEITDEKS